MRLDQLLPGYAAVTFVADTTHRVEQEKVSYELTRFAAEMVSTSPYYQTRAVREPATYCIDSAKK